MKVRREGKRLRHLLFLLSLDPRHRSACGTLGTWLGLGGEFAL
jgi:hypothetical protein